MSVKSNEEYIWNYNNYFRENKFIKSYDALDWIVIGPSRHKNSYKLTEGDFVKLGKLVFFVRKIKSSQNENLNETKRNSSFDNSEMNLGNNINDDIIIHNKNINENYIDTNNGLIENGAKKINNLNITNKVNVKLKSLYVKLKNINKSQKKYRCRICFCEGNFEGNNPLISPCKCSGSVKYIHLNCLRKWLTTKITTKISSNNDIYCYVFKSLKCEICQSIIPEIAEFRGKFLSLLDFKNIDPPYIILQSMYQYNSTNRNVNELNIIFVISFKTNAQVNIGRANNSNIRLSDVSVSRNHAKLTYSKGDFFLDDIGSKFGSLLLIQNNVLFLPNKNVSIQAGKSHLTFYLRRTCLGLFKCYKNKLYDKKSYLDSFFNNEKKVYNQILETFNYNIIDPVEKFSSISGSCTPSKKSSVTIEENKINETNSDNKDIKDDEKSESKSEEKENKDLNLNISNGQKNNNYEFIDTIPILNLNINKLNKDILIREDDKINDDFEQQRKQNESREMLFDEIKNKDNNINNNGKYDNNKNYNFTKINVMNLLNKNIINKRAISVANNGKKENNNLKLSEINDKNQNNDLAMTQRDNKKNDKKNIESLNKEKKEE